MTLITVLMVVILATIHKISFYTYEKQLLEWWWRAHNLPEVHCAQFQLYKV